MTAPLSNPLPACERETRARDYHREVDDGSLWDMLSEDQRDCYRQSADLLYAKWFADPLAQLNADLSAARAERDEALRQNDYLRKTNHVENQRWLSDQLFAAEAEASALREERDAFRDKLAEMCGKMMVAQQALKPFAEAAEDLCDDDHDAGHLWEAPAAMSLTAGNLRQARAALASHPDPKEASDV